MNEERTEAWKSLYRVVSRDHAEYCTDLRCDCEATSRNRTTKLYRAIADEAPNCTYDCSGCNPDDGDDE